MIPIADITAWSLIAPWGEPRQVEQDLIISRALVEIFNHPRLCDALRFRGGTALNKVIFPAPLRYSEDIDLVRTEAGPIGPILDDLREVLEPWLGRGAFAVSPVAPKLRFRVPAEDEPDVPIRLKVETNIAEIEAFDPPASITFSVDNPWFSGSTTVATFSREELLATKLRALLQRDKGRDLFDLSHALTTFEDLDIPRIIDMFRRYLALRGQAISRAQAEQRMLAKFERPDLLGDMRPLLPPDVGDALSDARARTDFIQVFERLIVLLPGQPWARTAEIAQKLDLPEIATTT